MLLLEAKRSPSNGSAAKNCSVTGSDKSRRPIPLGRPDRMRDAAPAVARQPLPFVFDAAVQVAAAPVLGDERDERGEKVWHGGHGTETPHLRPVGSGSRRVLTPGPVPAILGRDSPRHTGR